MKAKEGNRQYKELSDEELERAVGGSLKGISEFTPNKEGLWFRFSLDQSYIYRVRKAYDIFMTPGGDFSSAAALLDRFLYNGSEAWYKGTVTEIDCNGPKEYYEEIAAPANIHE